MSRVGQSAATSKSAAQAPLAKQPTAETEEVAKAQAAAFTSLVTALLPVTREPAGLSVNGEVSEARRASLSDLGLSEALPLLVSTNALPTNALATSALSTNALATSALSTNALATNALPTNALATNALATSTSTQDTASPADRAGSARVGTALPAAELRDQLAMPGQLEVATTDIAAAADDVSITMRQAGEAVTTVESTVLQSASMKQSASVKDSAAQDGQARGVRDAAAIPASEAATENGLDSEQRSTEQRSTEQRSTEQRGTEQRGTGKSSANEHRAASDAGSAKPANAARPETLKALMTSAPDGQAIASKGQTAQTAQTSHADASASQETALSDTAQLADSELEGLADEAGAKAADNPSAERVDISRPIESTAGASRLLSRLREAIPGAEVRMTERGGETHVELQHPELGRMELQFGFRDSTMEVAAIVDSFASATALRENEKRLAQDVAKHGVALELRVDRRSEDNPGSRRRASRHGVDLEA